MPWPAVAGRFPPVLHRHNDARRTRFGSVRFRRHVSGARSRSTRRRDPMSHGALRRRRRRRRIAQRPLSGRSDRVGPACAHQSQVAHVASAQCGIASTGGAFPAPFRWVRRLEGADNVVKRDFPALKEASQIGWIFVTERLPMCRKCIGAMWNAQLFQGISLHCSNDLRGIRIDLRYVARVIALDVSICPVVMSLCFARARPGCDGGKTVSYGQYF